MDRPSTVALLAALLALATVAVYAPVLGFGFINLDDDLYVTANPHVQRGLTLDGLVWALGDAHTSVWHPLTWVTHMLDCELYGLRPGGHHATNVVLHAANAVLLVLVLSRMTGAPWRSAMAASMFALHPLRIESVAWVAERKDLLAALGWLLALAAYAAYAARPRLRALLLVTLAFTLGLLAKPTVVTLPFVLLLLDWWPLGRLRSPGSARRLAAEKLPLLALTLAATAAGLLAGRSAAAFAGLGRISLAARVGNALVAYVRYLGNTVWPSGLAVFYPLPAAWSAWQVAGAALVLALLTLATLALARRRPYLPVGWLWFVGTLVPAIGLVQAGSQSMADRFTYLPHMGLFVALTWGAADLLAERVPRPILAGGAAALLGVLALATTMQLRYWESSERLFARALAVTRDNWLAHNNLGDALLRRGQNAEAATHFEAALRLWPDYPDAHYNLGVALAHQGKLEAAAAELATALRFQPERVPALLNLGLALDGLGRTDEAIAHLGRAVELDPAYADARAALGSALMRKGRTDEGITQLAEAVRLRPDFAEAHYNLSLALGERGRAAEAAEHLREAVRLRPDLGAR